MKKLTMKIIIAFDLIVDFFVVYFTAMQIHTFWYRKAPGSADRFVTSLGYYPGKVIPWYIVLGIITISLIVIYVKKFGNEKPAVSQNKDLEPSADIMFCKHCGKQIAADSVFCKYCGAKVDE